MKPLALLCLILVIAIPAAAQVPGSPVSFSFGVQGDITNVNVGGGSMTAIKIDNGTVAGIGGNVQDIFGVGYGGGAHLDLGLGLLSLRLQGDYITLSPDNAKLQSTIASLTTPAFASLFSVSGGKIEIWTASLNAKLTILPLPFIKPYVTGGIGLASLTVTEATISVSGIPVYKVKPIDSQTKGAYNVGAGVDFVFGGVTLYAEARLNFVQTDPKATAQVPVGLVGLTF